AVTPVIRHGRISPKMSMVFGIGDSDFLRRFREPQLHTRFATNLCNLPTQVSRQRAMEQSDAAGKPALGLACEALEELRVREDEVPFSCPNMIQEIQLGICPMHLAGPPPFAACFPGCGLDAANDGAIFRNGIEFVRPGSTIDADKLEDHRSEGLVKLIL